MILRALEALNRAPWWAIPVATWGGRFKPPSMDRLAYLWLHKLGIMGGDRALIEAQVQPGMVVADIGANVGLYTHLLARCTGDRGFVYAFEPDPELFASLQTNCHINALGNVHLENVALGARDEMLTLTRSRFNSGDNRLSERPASAAGTRLTVRVRALDALLGGRKLDFIKIDVQGWELEVFKGMSQQLEGSSPLRILFEFWPEGLRATGTEPSALLRFLRDHRFGLFRTESQTIIPVASDDGLIQAIKPARFVNLIAIR